MCYQNCIKIISFKLYDSNLNFYLKEKKRSHKKRKTQKEEKGKDEEKKGKSKEEDDSEVHKS